MELIGLIGLGDIWQNSMRSRVNANENGSLWGFTDANGSGCRRCHPLASKTQTSFFPFGYQACRLSTSDLKTISNYQRRPSSIFLFLPSFFLIVLWSRSRSEIWCNGPIAMGKFNLLKERMQILARNRQNSSIINGGFVYTIAECITKQKCRHDLWKQWCNN